MFDDFYSLTLICSLIYKLSNISYRVTLFSELFDGAGNWSIVFSDFRVVIEKDFCQNIIAEFPRDMESLG